MATRSLNFQAFPCISAGIWAIPSSEECGWRQRSLVDVWLQMIEMCVETLHAGLGWSAATAIVVFSFLTSLISAAFGLGGGSVMLAVLANLLPAPAIIPVHGVVQVGSNFGRAVVLLRHVDRSVFLPFALGSIAGVALGGMIAVQLPSALVQIGVGLFILWSVLLVTSANHATFRRVRGDHVQFPHDVLRRYGAVCRNLCPGPGP